MSLEKIKSVSLDMFAQNGYEGTSLAAVAKAVGITKASIYYHFKSKEEIFLTILDDIMNDEINNIKRVTKEIEPLDIEEKIYRLFVFYYQKNVTNKMEADFWKRAMLFSPQALAEKTSEKFKAYENVSNEILASTFEEGIRQGVIRTQSIENVLAAFYCIVDGIFVEIHYYGLEEFEARLDSIWKVFWNGIVNMD